MSSFADFAQERHRVSGIAADLADWLTEVSQSDAAQLRSFSERFRMGRFHVLVLGGFSVGKSTLVNALLGKPVLPSKINPCTAILTELTYGDNPGVEVHRRDGSTTHTSMEEFLRTFQLESTGKDAFSEVERAIIEWPLELLRDGVTLIDTPGLDDDPIRTRRTLAAIPDADAVILVLNATRFLTHVERELLTREIFPRKLDNLFFPITMADQLDRLSTDSVRERQRLMEQASSDLHSSRVYLVDALGDLQARQTKKTPADAGFLTFEESLRQFLVEDRGQAQIQRFRATVDDLRQQLHGQFEREQAVFGASLESLRQRESDLQPAFERLQQRIGAIDGRAARFIADQELSVLASLRNFALEVEAELPQQVARALLRKRTAFQWWTPDGRQAVEHGLKDQLERWLTQQIAQWNQAASQRLSEEVQQLRQELAPQAKELQASLHEIQSVFAGIPLPNPPESKIDPTERWFSVAVGAILLSPATMAAGWNSGYEGALQGATGRLAARISVLLLGLALGPLGWVGLALYGVSDLLVLWWAGDRQIQDFKHQWTDATRGQLVKQVDERAAEIRKDVAVALAPFRAALVDAATQDVEKVRAEIERTIRRMAETTESREEHQQLWKQRLVAFELALQELG